MICLYSCGDIEFVRFETAQPYGVKASESFNRKIKGEYINCSNPDDRLIIFNNLILNARTVKLKCHRTDLDFDSTIAVDKSTDEVLIDLFSMEGYKVNIMGDTINISQTNVDTVFWISENQVLKKFKGSYFLNFKLDENFWDVTRLNLTKDTLLIGQISPSDTLLRFDFVEKTEDFNPSDSTTTTEYFIKPSKKEFKKLMKPNSFKACACYFKTNK